ncbi:hypothetical protein A8C56_13755 [Niabella ginsenosidivorans]|uniref:DNA topoisomerase n=1 Tax=Niabella ginsenosidivorans TaxID=1176587 RepID=A0A1A9I2L3_9BACT|nr:DNA topoisomerase IB [Niabella ginsenosidivorans]ANH81897.1 hypothetical protein A8C56_13755 [Niabella ginsenosidivorans]
MALFKQLEQVPCNTAGNSKHSQLVYIAYREQGIRRIKKNNAFIYTQNGRVVKNKKTLSRIRGLAIPPAWTNVWISDKENGHLQCTGVDTMGRTQYRYHSLWNTLQKETKFHRLLQFGRALGRIRKKADTHLSGHRLSRQKILATVVSTLDKTGLRLGNTFYEKLYGSFGLSTLQNRHTRINGNKVTFSFKGKKGIYQHVSIKSRRLARVIGQCKEIPGKELFQYIDESGGRHPIKSEDVNAYIRKISGGDFTSKDFRTWTGTVSCIRHLLEKGPAKTKSEVKENIISALEEVSQTLGNTRTVCKKHYVHPLILNLYETGDLFRYASHKPDQEDDPESVLLQLLAKET